MTFLAIGFAFGLLSLRSEPREAGSPQSVVNGCDLNAGGGAEAAG